MPFVVSWQATLHQVAEDRSLAVICGWTPQAAHYFIAEKEINFFVVLDY